MESRQGQFAPRPIQQPGLGDVEAAVELVAAGVATHVVLSGFPGWPRLLTRARELAARSGVEISPAIGGRSGGVDIIVTRHMSE